jgi:acyl-CoA reductase-like NAD-dependent aldehyde dehydrogenase
MVIAQEEIFSPVLALMKVETFEEALQVANDVKFGSSNFYVVRNVGSHSC